MFGLFKKKSKTTAEMMLGLSNKDFLLSVLSLIKLGPPAAQVMRVIAHENLEPMIQATAQVAKENPDKKFPKSIEEHILFLEKAMSDDANDEISARRLGWFFQAALLKRAEEIWKGRSEYNEIMASVWIAIADGCCCLPALIQSVAIWSDQEKMWFCLIRSEKEAIEYCLNHVAPKEIRQITRIMEYAKNKNIRLSP